MWMLESSLVSTRNNMSGFVECIVACSWETFAVDQHNFWFIFCFSICSVGGRCVCWIRCKCMVFVTHGICIVAAVWKRLQG